MEKKRPFFYHTFRDALVVFILWCVCVSFRRGLIFEIQSISSANDMSLKKEQNNKYENLV